MTMPGHEACGIHLLAYSYYSIGDYIHALPNFKKVINRIRYISLSLLNYRRL